ncbi:MAG: 2'-5' RNA ligase [Flavobacteriales bacterium]|jgi:2'-5' RNA ligase
MKAISIALIPIQIQDRQALIDTSAKVNGRNAFLNHTDQLPHVTLAMGVSPDSKIKRIIQAVSAWQGIQLKSSGISAIPRSTSSDLVWLNMDRDLMLLALHEKAMHLLPQDDELVLPQHFGNSEGLSGAEVDYVQTFAPQAHEHYQPHITLGYGKEVKWEKSNLMEFKAGVFHLGPSCTCYAELT